MDKGFDQEIGTISPKEKTGLELLNELNELAPFDPEHSAEALVETGWAEITSYYEYEANGAINTDHIRIALDDIHREASLREDWALCRAKMDQFKADRIAHDHARAVLKRKTQARIDWEAKIEH